MRNCLLSRGRLLIFVLSHSQVLFCCLGLAFLSVVCLLR